MLNQNRLQSTLISRLVSHTLEMSESTVNHDVACKFARDNLDSKNHQFADATSQSVDREMTELADTLSSWNCDATTNRLLSAYNQLKQHAHASNDESFNDANHRSSRGLRHISLAQRLDGSSRIVQLMLRLARPLSMRDCDKLIEFDASHFDDSKHSSLDASTLHSFHAHNFDASHADDPDSLSEWSDDPVDDDDERQSIDQQIQSEEQSVNQQTNDQLASQGSNDEPHAEQPSLLLRLCEQNQQLQSTHTRSHSSIEVSHHKHSPSNADTESLLVQHLLFASLGHPTPLVAIDAFTSRHVLAVSYLAHQRHRQLTTAQCRVIECAFKCIDRLSSLRRFSDSASRSSLVALTAAAQCLIRFIRSIDDRFIQFETQSRINDARATLLKLHHFMLKQSSEIDLLCQTLGLIDRDGHIQSSSCTSSAALIDALYISISRECKSKSCSNGINLLLTLFSQALSAWMRIELDPWLTHARLPSNAEQKADFCIQSTADDDDSTVQMNLDRLTQFMHPHAHSILTCGQNIQLALRHSNVSFFSDRSEECQTSLCAQFMQQIDEALPQILHSIEQSSVNAAASTPNRQINSSVAGFEKFNGIQPFNDQPDNHDEADSFKEPEASNRLSKLQASFDALFDPPASTNNDKSECIESFCLPSQVRSKWIHLSVDQAVEDASTQDDGIPRDSYLSMIMRSKSQSAHIIDAQSQDETLHQLQVECIPSLIDTAYTHALHSTRLHQSSARLLSCFHSLKMPAECLLLLSMHCNHGQLVQQTVIPALIDCINEQIEDSNTPAVSLQMLNGVMQSTMHASEDDDVPRITFHFDRCDTDAESQSRSNGSIKLFSFASLKPAASIVPDLVAFNPHSIRSFSALRLIACVPAPLSLIFDPASLDRLSTVFRLQLSFAWCHARLHSLHTSSIYKLHRRSFAPVVHSFYCLMHSVTVTIAQLRQHVTESVDRVLQRLERRDFNESEGSGWAQLMQSMASIDHPNRDASAVSSTEVIRQQPGSQSQPSKSVLSVSEMHKSWLSLVTELESASFGSVPCAPIRACVLSVLQIALDLDCLARSELDRFLNESESDFQLKQTDPSLADPIAMIKAYRTHRHALHDACRAQIDTARQSYESVMQHMLTLREAVIMHHPETSEQLQFELSSTRRAVKVAPAPRLVGIETNPGPAIRVLAWCLWSLVCLTCISQSFSLTTCQDSDPLVSSLVTPVFALRSDQAHNRMQLQLTRQRVRELTLTPSVADAQRSASDEQSLAHLVTVYQSSRLNALVHTDEDSDFEELEQPSMRLRPHSPFAFVYHVRSQSLADATGHWHWSIEQQRRHSMLHMQVEEFMAHRDDRHGPSLKLRKLWIDDYRRMTPSEQMHFYRAFAERHDASVMTQSERQSVLTDLSSVLRVFDRMKRLRTRRLGRVESVRGLDVYRTVWLHNRNESSEVSQVEKAALIRALDEFDKWHYLWRLACKAVTSRSGSYWSNRYHAVITQQLRYAASDFIAVYSDMNNVNALPKLARPNALQRMNHVQSLTTMYADARSGDNWPISIDSRMKKRSIEQLYWRDS